MAGLWFEEFEVGAVIEHANRRTVTETDNVLFSTMTLNMAPLHLDAEYSAQSIYGQRLVNSLFLMGLACGISVPETTQGTTLGNLGFTEVKFPMPAFHGDTIRVETEIVDKRESKSRTDSGIVYFRHKALNQRGELVADIHRTGLMLKRPVAESV